jgi:hypothetical protein
VNKGNSKCFCGHLVALIMVAAVVSAITPPVSASAVQLYKETYPDPSASYTLGQTIDYLCRVTCPGDAVNDLGPADVWDQLPNGTWVQLDHNLYLNKTAHKDYHVFYVVTQADVDLGYVTNHLNVSGHDMGGQGVGASVDETSGITGKRVPALATVGLLLVAGLLLSAGIYSLKRRKGARN